LPRENNINSNHTNFNTIASTYGETITDTKKHITLPLFKKILGDVNGKRVADLGCGDGFFTRIIATEKPLSIVGIDIAEKLIEKSIQREQQEQKGILYQCKDIRSLEKKECFELITAVYLLNFAMTKEDLFIMLQSTYNNLNKNGKFCAIIPHPKIKLTSGFELGRKIYPNSKNDTFSDGDKVEYRIGNERKNIHIIYYYWSKETYENCLRKAGFTRIEWQEPTISPEAIALFGKEYWSNYQQNPSSIGLICWKD